MILAHSQVILEKWIEELVIKFQTYNDAESLQSARNLEELISWVSVHSIELDEIYKCLAKLLRLEWDESLVDCIPSVEFIDKYPISLARDKSILGLEKQDGMMPVAIAGFEAIEQLDIVGRYFDCDINPFFVPVSQLQSAINAAYQQRGSQTIQTINNLDPDEAFSNLSQLKNREDLLETSGRAPVIKLVNSVLFDAAQSRASDIHIQPFEEDLRVRFRIDGVLFDQFRIPKASQEEVISRIKVIGEMNIAEKRLPQDGRASVQIGDRMIDLRIASIPTSFGERVVIRLLDKSARLYTLEDLGMPKDILASFRKLIHLEHGLILVTGPTGGGKSTTLYAGLQEINTNHSNVVTLEDPIEYQLAGISQTQVSDKKGMTFASGLRSVLRQDPDIIMVGEIRDRETAEMAIQSALTGHMVFSTLHTNDAPSAVNRILDLGIEPYLVASSLIGVLAQRLVRRICLNCRIEDSAAVDRLSSLGSVPANSSQTPFRGKGCTACRGTGYQGRIGLFELMLVDDSIRSLIQTRRNASEIREVACQNGMRLLREDGLEKILSGMTTIEEVVRVSMQTV